MQIVIIGGAGVLGQALMRAIVARGALTRSDGTLAPVGRVISVDRHQPPRLLVESRIEYVRADLGNPRLLSAVMGTVTDSIFHAWDAAEDFASGAGDDGNGTGNDAAQDAMAPTFALIDSLRDLFRNCASQALTPKVVLASTYAAAGPHSPGSAAGGGRPQSAGSEGLRLRVAELLLAAACGLGRIDGRALRLPPIAAAPGPGSFVGALVAALCQGVAADCPVPSGATLYLASAASAAQALVHAHELPAAAWTQADALYAPSQAMSIDQLVAAAGRCAGRPLAAPVFLADPAAPAAPVPPDRAIEQALQLGFAPGPDADALVAELMKPAAR